MTPPVCANCGSPAESGFLTTTNGSGLFWAKEASSSRFRPKGLEVVVGTGYTGTYSANLPGVRCTKCGTLTLQAPASPK
jgi:hypothetical protein